MIKANKERNIKGIVRELIDTVLIVCLKKIGINPAINALISAIRLFCVSSKDIIYTINTNVDANIFGIIFATNVIGMNILKTAKT